METHTLELDKPRKLHYGFKALRIIREKYGEKKELTDIMNVNVDEIPFFAYAGLVKEDESLTPERVEELIDDTIPGRYTVLDIVGIIVKAIADQMGVKVKKKAKTKKKTPLLTTVKSHSK